jgi:cyclophilin family peptidyl-prolyl cis-trans isomerase
MKDVELTHRRGLVGMANSGKRNTNTSQFFFTLDKADELTNKHTMFGKVVGNTIYSMSFPHFFQRRMKGPRK